MVRLGMVVEGHAEVEAVPLLIRRWGLSLPTPVTFHVPSPVRVSRGKLLKDTELERATELAAAKAGPGCAVCVLIDGDDDCPAELGPTLLDRVLRAARNRFLVSVVLAHREFESWFLAAAASLAGVRGLPDPLQPPIDVEAIRGAKGWLSERMGTSGYSEVLDKPALVEAMSFDDAQQRSDSFHKFCRELQRFVDSLENP